MSYRQLDVWKLAREASNAIHRMSVTQLPKFELYETGSQIRRSSKSVRANIVEGYGRRRYKAEFVRFLVFTVASNDETMDHLESLYETRSLQDEAQFKQLRSQVDELGRKLNRFIASVESAHRTGPTPK
jgi:four helix bundle protein